MRSRMLYNASMIFGRIWSPAFVLLAAYMAAHFLSRGAYWTAAFQFVFVVIQLSFSHHFWLRMKYERTR